MHHISNFFKFLQLLPFLNFCIALLAVKTRIIENLSEKNIRHFICRKIPQMSQKSTLGQKNCMILSFTYSYCFFTHKLKGIKTIFRHYFCSVPTGVGIPTTSQIRGVFGHQCNPGPILPHLYVKNIVLAQKLAKLQNF